MAKRSTTTPAPSASTPRIPPEAPAGEGGLQRRAGLTEPKRGDMLAYYDPRHQRPDLHRVAIVVGEPRAGEFHLKVFGDPDYDVKVFGVEFHRQAVTFVDTRGLGGRNPDREMVTWLP